MDGRRPVFGGGASAVIAASSRLAVVGDGVRVLVAPPGARTVSAC